MKLHWKAYARPLLGLMLGATLVAVVACGGDDDDDDVAPAPAAPAATAAPAAPAATAAPAAPAATAAPAAPGAPAATAAPAAPAATAAPGAPAATAAPAATVAATSAPAVTVKPEGEATVAINPVQPRSGTPRFCSAGCAEAVYQSSIFETLFRPNYQDFLGEFPEEPVIATGFTLDSANVPPQWLDFDIRAGVPFHEGWGDVTAEDVVFSFNDANANTQPESVHGQAGDFAPLIKRLEVKGPLQVRLIYNNYDSRGIRHRFSTFWQTASIVSEKVFEKFGPDGMRDQLIGTGPFTIQGDDWIPQDRMVSYAVEDHYRHTASVAKITALQVGESAQMAALLRTGGVIMSMPALKDWKALIKEGYELNTDTGHGIIRNIGMTGNYWEPTRFYDGKVLEREVADKAWVSASKLVDPEGYENARLVRQGLAHSIDRQGIVDSILDGFGMGPVYFGYQPPPTHPLYQAGVYDDKTWGGPGGEGGWEYAYDLDLAQDFLTKAGYPDGFPMKNVWVGPPGLTHELMIVMGGLWSTELNIDITLNNSAYQTYRPGLVARSTSEPFLSCGDDSNTSMPYDWARGFVMSSWSDGGYGVGMEVPWAAANYAKVALMTDKAERLAANIEFTKKGIEEAICIGIVHDPINTMQDPDAIAEYEKLPTAEGNYGTLNNMESLVLK